MAAIARAKSPSEQDETHSLRSGRRPILFWSGSSGAGTTKTYLRQEVIQGIANSLDGRDIQWFANRIVEEPTAHRSINLTEAEADALIGAGTALLKDNAAGRWKPAKR